ncbi:amino acid transporter AVT6E [Selaginella moellendorffii]|nr:amino acid transporter AVT6E [Selaginella moellendorffii]|eukprot:XP_002960581.2 amino acid transporter AVT6E [Selaginella moellendorffii]
MLPSSSVPQVDPGKEEEAQLLESSKYHRSDANGAAPAQFGAPGNGSATGYSILEISTGERQSSSSSSGSGVAGAVFNLATSIIGAGIMALPATMRVLGVPLGVAMILAMGVLSEISLEIVVRFSTQLKAWSYGEMVGAACGRAGKLVSQVCIIVNNSGILIVYLIIIGDVLSGSSSGSSHHPGLLKSLDRRLVLLATMLLVLAPLSSLKRIDSLRFSSAASVALAVVFVILSSGVAVVKGIQGKLTTPRSLPSLASRKSVLELLTVVPIMTNAFICHFNIQPIYCELKNRSAARMNKVGRISTLLCMSVYIATALSGYLLFGESTASDILSNFDHDLGIADSTLINDVIRIGYVLHLMLVFPVIHFSLRQNVDAILFPDPKQQLADSTVRFWALTASLLAIVFVGSAFIPNIWIAFQFTGATAGLSLGFMFPALVALRLSKAREKGLECLAWTMLVLAGVASFLGLTTNIYNVVTHHVD